MLLTFLSTNQTRIVEALYERICQATQPEAQFAPDVLRDNIVKGAAAFVAALQADDPMVLERFIADLIAPRTVEEFPLAVLHRAFTVFGEMLLPLLRECYGDDTVRILDELQRLHLLINAILQTLVTYYETRSKALVRSQQEQLQAYSQQLEAQLVQVGEEFQTLQDFNESIIQSITSGLLVADKDTHRILKINQAMERLSGFHPADIVGKTVEEVFTGLHDISLQDCADEIERLGHITRRTHRLFTTGGHAHYHSIHGQVLYNQRGDNQGVVVLVDDISETELLRETLSRYLSPQVMAQVLSDTGLRSLRSARREVTVFFADIRNFTAFAERHQPEEVVDVLNEYFDLMVHVLFEHQGTLDKFLGDGLLALFGTPLEQVDHAQRAVQAALDIQRATTALNAVRRHRGQPTLHLGIGINSGEAIVGNIGSEKRMEYTVVGDMVNVAQRLQTQAGGGEILIGASLFPHVQHLVSVYDTVEMQVRGRQQPVWAHRIGPLQP